MPLSKLTTRDIEQMMSDLREAPRQAQNAQNPEILVLAGQGFTRPEIAEKLGLNYQTVQKKVWRAARNGDAHHELDGYTPATVKAHVAYLRAAMRYAYKKGELAVLPWFPTIKADNARTGFFEREEFERVVACLPEPHADIARFGYGCGWRLSEILGLQWSEVDRVRGVIRLTNSKNGHGRILPLVGELGKIIERAWRNRIMGNSLSEWVFHRAGKRIPRTRYWEKWTETCKQAGVSGRLFHDLRRTAARDMIAAGCDYQTAMAVTGHRSMSMFMRYQIVDVRGIQHGLEALEAHRKRPH
jgi:integrase